LEPARPVTAELIPFYPIFFEAPLLFVVDGIARAYERRI